MVETYYFEFDKEKIKKDNVDEKDLHMELDTLFNQIKGKKVKPGVYYTEGKLGSSITVLMTLSSLPEMRMYLSRFDCEINCGGEIEKGSYLDAIIPQ